MSTELLELASVTLIAFMQQHAPCAWHWRNCRASSDLCWTNIDLQLATKLDNAVSSSSRSELPVMIQVAVSSASFYWHLEGKRIPFVQWENLTCLFMPKSDSLYFPTGRYHSSSFDASVARLCRSTQVGRRANLELSLMKPLTWLATSRKSVLLWGRQSSYCIWGCFSVLSTCSFLLLPRLQSPKIRIFISVSGSQDTLLKRL